MPSPPVLLLSLAILLLSLAILLLSLPAHLLSPPVLPFSQPDHLLRLLLPRLGRQTAALA
jgi:hypothetical protein